MANITRFDPFGDLASFRRMGDLDSLFKGLRLQPCAGDLEGELRIKVDVEEDERNYTVKADIPGVNKDDIHVSVEGSQVSIEAEVKKETEEKKSKNEELFLLPTTTTTTTTTRTARRRGRRLGGRR